MCLGLCCRLRCCHVVVRAPTTAGASAGELAQPHARMCRICPHPSPVLHRCSSLIIFPKLTRFGSGLQKGKEDLSMFRDSSVSFYDPGDTAADSVSFLSYHAYCLRCVPCSLLGAAFFKYVACGGSDAQETRQVSTESIILHLLLVCDILCTECYYDIVNNLD